MTKCILYNTALIVVYGNRHLGFRSEVELLIRSNTRSPRVLVVIGPLQRGDGDPLVTERERTECVKFEPTGSGRPWSAS